MGIQGWLVVRVDNDEGVEMVNSAGQRLLDGIRELRPDLVVFLDPKGDIPLSSGRSGGAISTFFGGTEEPSFVSHQEFAPKIFAKLKHAMVEGDKALHQQRSSRRFTGLMTSRRQGNTLTIGISSALTMEHEVC
eukprot:sb/3474813/